MTFEQQSPEKQTKTRLTNDQLRDLAYSSMYLIDIDPTDGTSTIMDGLEQHEYHAAMRFRQRQKQEKADLHDLLVSMAAIRHTAGSSA